MIDDCYVENMWTIPRMRKMTALSSTMQECLCGTQTMKIRRCQLELNSSMVTCSDFAGSSSALEVTSIIASFGTIKKSYDLILPLMNELQRRNPGTQLPWVENIFASSWDRFCLFSIQTASAWEPIFSSKENVVSSWALCSSEIPFLSFSLITHSKNLQPGSSSPLYLRQAWNNFPLLPRTHLTMLVSKPHLHGLNKGLVQNLEDEEEDMVIRERINWLRLKFGGSET